MEFNTQEAQVYLRQALQRSDHQIEKMSISELSDYAAGLLQDYVRRNFADQLETCQDKIQELVNNSVGFGPLTSLLADTSVSEIMVNRFNLIFVERDGQLFLSNKCFTNEDELRQVIDRIITPLGRRLDNSQPMVDARMPDGSRINAVISPIALNGSCLTVRKFLAKQLTFEDLQQQGALSSLAANYLKNAIKQRRNILIAGGTGTGKTTLLNTLASYIDAPQRLITIEDAAELQLNHPNLIALEARPKNTEGKGLVTIRDLLVNALRMRPDRIIIGECRGAEAIDMLQAMNTGHDGSLTTLHANTARDALQRLEMMVLMAGLELPLSAVRQQIASAVDIVVQIYRQSDGQRVISEISEVVSFDAQVIQLSQLFVRRDGQLQTTGVRSEWG